MTIYDRIRAQRERQKMSQQELATAVGYKTRSAINKIELGLRDISQNQIEGFAHALGVTPAYLMGWENEKGEQDLVLKELYEQKNQKKPAPSDRDELDAELIKMLTSLDNPEDIAKVRDYVALLKAARKD